MERKDAVPFTIFAPLMLTLALVSSTPEGAFAQSVGNAACPGEDVFFDPHNGEDIVVPEGFTVEVFAKGLNFPTAIAFKGNKEKFDVFVLESGRGLPSRCNDNEAPAFGGKFSATNPFTPDILVFDDSGHKIAGPLGKPTPTGGGFQPDGPAIDLAFEHGFQGGRLFATDSNQSRNDARARQNSSRIVTANTSTGGVTSFITGLPTGDHPTEQLAFQGEFIFWSQGSATNSGVVGHDNGNGTNQHDIPCQDITLGQNLFDSGDGHMTSGYSDHGVRRPGETVKAFEGATKQGMCTGAILRAKVNAKNPADTIEPFSWGYRNPFGIRFAPQDHPLKGGLFVAENGEDERGARPTNNAPDRLQLAQQNPDGTPDYHGWPNRFGFLDSTQAVFDPVGGPGDDLCVPAPSNPPSFCTATSLANILGEDRPVKPVLAFPPQPPVAPLALEPADVAVVGIDFVSRSFVHGVVKGGAALLAREGDFGFSKPNGEPEEGHDVQLVNFSRPGEPLKLELSRFAFNRTFEQAFVDELHGINRPVDLKFGPDGCGYLVDYGAVRDFGQSDPKSKFRVAGDGPLVQIPGTGVIWKICSVGAVAEEGN